MNTKLDPHKIKLGIAPINWTNDDLPELGAQNNFEQCISEMALANYEGCEIGTLFPKEAKVLKPFLDIRGIRVANAWFSAEFSNGKYEETVKAFIKHRDYLYELGAKVIGVGEVGVTIHGSRNIPLFSKRPQLSDQQWEELYKGLNKIADLANEKGMELAFHYHIGTGIENEAEIDKVMEHTQPNVKLLIDTGHIFLATQSQAALERVTRKYIDRTAHIHLKNVRLDVLKKGMKSDLSFLDLVFNGVFTVPGDNTGVIDFEPFFEIVAKSNFKGWMIVEAEQDPAIANAFEYALKSRQFIREMTGL